MINQEIVWGLKLALEKGNALKDAMMSFYNAGYDKKEIEEAAKALQTQQPSLFVPQPQKPEQMPISKPSKSILKPKEKLEEEILKTPKLKPARFPVQKPQQPQAQIPTMPVQQIPAQIPVQQIPQVIQVVSKYDEKTNRNALIVILVVALVSLFGVLSALLIFKNEIVTLLSKLF